MFYYSYSKLNVIETFYQDLDIYKTTRIGYKLQ